MKHLLSIDLLSREEVVEILYQAMDMVRSSVSRHGIDQVSHGRLISVFTEKSTRTRNSFENAAPLLGMEVNNCILGDDSSLGKGESWSNTFRMLAQYGPTAIVIRSRIEGLGLHLAQIQEKQDPEVSWVPNDVSILIGGAGTRNHPSQILLDLLCIVLGRLGIKHRTGECLTKLKRLMEAPVNSLKEWIAHELDTLKIAFTGGLLHSRVVHDWINLGRLFNIQYLFVAPREFQVEDWCLSGIKYGKTQRLGEARGYDIVYCIRLQKERLPEDMQKRTLEFDRMLTNYQISSQFLSRFKGEVMDALPIDENTPTIPQHLRNHPQVVFSRQSAMGIPTRMAILMLCDRDRQEKFPLLTVPTFRLKPAYVLKSSTLAKKWEAMKEKYEGKPMPYGWITSGTVIDRIPPGVEKLIALVNERAGIFPKNKRPVNTAENIESETLGLKSVIGLHDCWPPWSVAATYGILAPSVRLSVMRPKMEKKPGGQGYRRVELPLPEVVAGIFPCPNPDCVTNVDPEAQTYFRVIGQKNTGFGLYCVYCQRHFDSQTIVAGFRKQL